MSLTKTFSNAFWFHEWEKADRETKLIYWEKALAWANEEQKRINYLNKFKKHERDKLLVGIAASFLSQDSYE